jgi:PAS domain S-box-containing protein
MRFLRDISIGVKILIPPLFFAVALAAVAALAFVTVNAQQRAMNTVHDIILSRAELIHDFILQSEQLQSDVFRLSVLHFMNLPEQDTLPISERIDRGLSDLDVTYGRIERSGQLDDEEQRLLGLVEEPMEVFSRQARQAADVVADDPAFGVLLVRSSAVSFAEFRDTLDRFLEYQDLKASQLESDSARQALAVSRAILGVAIMIGASGVLTAGLISSRLISLPIIGMTKSMRLLAEGDHLVEVQYQDCRDEIGSMAQAVEVFRKQAIEKAQVEAALRRERDGAQKYLDIAGVMLVALDEEGIIRLINRQGCAILGYSEEDLIGKNWGEICLPARVRQRAGSEFIKLMEGSIDKFSQHENPVLARSGEERLIAWRTTVLTDEEGKRIGTLSSGEDITERRRAEIALQESEQRYRVLFEQAPDGMLLYSPDDAEIIDFNDRVHQNLGYTREEFAKLSLAEIDALESPEEAAKHVATAIREDGDTFETKHLTKDRQVRDVIVSTRPISIGGRILLQGIWKDTTELRRTESALRESEERYRALFEASPIAILVHSEGRIEFANPEATKVLGAETRQDLIGREAMDFVHSGFRAIAEARIQSVYDKKAAIGSYEERLVRCDGSAFEALVTRAMVDFMGRPASQTLIQDITEREKARRELQKLKDFNESIVQTMAEGVVIEDGKGNFTFVNPAAALMLGYSPDELLGKHYSLVVPEDQLQVVEEVDQRRREGEASQYELKVITKQGEIRDLLVSGSARHENGSFEGTLAVFTDITMLKGAERRLREREERFRSVAETAADAIVLAGSDGKISYWNRAAESIFGYQAAEVQGEPISMIMPKEMAESYERSMVRLIETGVGKMIRKPAVSQGLRKDGSVFPMELSLASWMSGDQLSFTTIIRDVTESRKAQERDQLQNRLAAVGQMAAGIAHDFNNILATIILNCEMLIQTPSLASGVRKRLVSVLKQAERAATLTSQILDFSRQSIMARHELDLVPFIKEMQSLLARILPESIVISLVDFREQSVVKADPTRMQQIFLNLALNARDAMPEGGELKLELAQVHVEAPESAPIQEITAGDWARISISDTGSGIAPEYMAHLFEPFFTTKPPGEGTGLGLAQVYGIARQHGGHIDVESIVGQGTTFKIYLPLLDRQQIREHESNEVDMDKGRGETILIVEDDDATRLAVADILETLNYSTLQAADGKQALEILERNADRTALVLTDLVMPGIGGEQLYKKVREMLPSLPVVVMTGYPLGDDTRGFLEEQQVRWMQKPFSSDKLATIVREAIALKT